MLGGHPMSSICSHGVIPLASLLTPSTTRLCFFIDKLQLPSNATKASPVFLPLSHRNRATVPPSLSPSDPEKLLIMSYLVRSCGLSPNTALHATRVVGRKNKEKAVAVIQLLRRYDFSDAQIEGIATKCVELLRYNPEKYLKPKLDFLLSEGFSVKEVADICSINCSLLLRNLERGLIATYRFLSATLPSRSDVLRAIKGGNYCLPIDYEPKLKMLRDNGVSEPVILNLVKRFPMILRYRLELLEEAVKTLLEWGVDPNSKMFIYSLNVLCYSSNTLLRKWKLYGELGWSESQVIDMFKKNPRFLTLSEELICHKVDFLTRNLGWEPEYIIRRPVVLTHSIERKFLPRVPILKILMSKGLIDNKFTASQFNSDDRRFSKRYVEMYTAEVPGIIEMYKDAKALLKN